MSQRVSFQVLLGQTGDVSLCAGETLDNAVLLEIGAFLPTFVFLAVILHLDLQGQQGAVRAEQTFYLDGIAGLGVTIYLGIGCDGHSLTAGLPGCPTGLVYCVSGYGPDVPVQRFDGTLNFYLGQSGSPPPFTSSSTKRF